MSAPRRPQPAADGSRRTPEAASATREQSEREFAQWLEEVDLEKLDLERLAGNPAVALDDDEDELVD